MRSRNRTHTLRERPRSRARRRNVRVVVVVDEVVHEHPARMGVGDRAGGAVRTGAVLRRGPVVVVLAVGVEPVLVLVELRVLDHQLPARVRAGVAERVVLRPAVVQGLVAHLLAGPDVVAGVVEVRDVGLIPRAAAPVAGEDPVARRGRLVAEVGAGRAQVVAIEPPPADLPAAVSPVPPDLVAGLARPGQEVAGGEVLDRDVVGLPDHDPVEPRTAWPEVLIAGARAARRGAGRGSVDDHGVAVHPAQREIRRGDQHGGRRVGGV